MELFIRLWNALNSLPEIKKAFSDFETLCPNVEQDKRVASFGCCPLAFPHDMREAYPIESVPGTEVLPLLASIGTAHLGIRQMEPLEPIHGQRGTGIRVEDRAVLGEIHGIVVDCHICLSFQTKIPHTETVQGTKN